MNFKIKYFFNNWKMLIHLLFGTFHFGVNNDLWNYHHSLYGYSKWKILIRIISNYKMMRIRSFIGFIPLNDAIKLFPDYSKKNNFKHIK